MTGGDNGKIQVWNYNNGQCIRVLDKGESEHYGYIHLNHYCHLCHYGLITGTDKETSDIKFITLNENK